MADVTFTVDGQQLTAPAGTLLIEACRAASIAIPQFCYYPGLSLQAACRMCLVRLEKGARNCKRPAPRRSPKGWS